MRGLTLDGTAEPVSRDRNLQANWDRENSFTLYSADETKDLQHYCNTRLVSNLVNVMTYKQHAKHTVVHVNTKTAVTESKKASSTSMTSESPCTE